MTWQEFLKLKAPCPEEYDFREEIVKFQSDDFLDRHAVYQAIGIAGDSRNKQKLGYEEACEVEEKYKRHDRIRSGGEADSCDLLQSIWKKLWEDKPYRAPCMWGEVLCGDTMDSCNTTLRELFLQKAFEKSDECAKADLISKRIFSSKSVRCWGKVTTIYLFQQHHEAYEKVIRTTKDAEIFLKAAYTVGNFIPWPVGCNGPRGTGCTKDYWDLALKCIYDWYRNNLSLQSTDLDNTTLFPICGTERTSIKNMERWLAGFGGWDDFVKGTYMQPFVFTKDERDVPDGWPGPFGSPKALWGDHFSGPVLPKEDKIGEFFTNAAERIRKRSELIVEALGGKENNA